MGPEGCVFVTVDPLVARTYATWAAVVAPEPERRVPRGVVYRVSLPLEAHLELEASCAHPPLPWQTTVLDSDAYMTSAIAPKYIEQLDVFDVREYRDTKCCPPQVLSA